MPAPSKLLIASKGLQRLSKDVQSYEAEVTKQKQTVADLQAAYDAKADKDEGNDKFMLKQNIDALKETEDVLPSVREKRDKQVQTVKDLLDEFETSHAETHKDDIATAKALLEQFQSSA